MAKLKNLVGQKFGRLTVLEYAERKNNRWYFKCQCDCGNICIVCGEDLKKNTKSCGCLQKEKTAERSTIHGMSGTRIYRIWKGIKSRCLNSNTPNYNNYGGRGITVFSKWINDFQAFFDYVSKLPHFGKEGYTLDRINNDGNYEPENVRWATKKEQARNTRQNRIVEYQDKKMTLIEAAEKSGINYVTLKGRVYRGEVGDKLFRPVRKNNVNK